MPRPSVSIFDALRRGFINKKVDLSPLKFFRLDSEDFNSIRQRTTINQQSSNKGKGSYRYHDAAYRILLFSNVIEDKPQTASEKNQKNNEKQFK